MRAGGLILILYIIVGVLVAISQNYFSGLGNVTDVLEAVVAVLVWPVLLFGVDINLGGGGGGGGGPGGGGGGGE